MANNYDNRYDDRDPSRRPYEEADRSNEDRGERPLMERAAYRPRRPYPDREQYADREQSYGDSERGFYATRAPRREEQRAVDPALQASGVTITEPESFMDVQKMIDKLRRGESIIVSLEALETESAQRILDFLSGASYALGGSMCRVKDMHSTFLVTPYGTGITDTNDDRYPR